MLWIFLIPFSCLIPLKARVGESVDSALSALAAIFSANSAYLNNFWQKIPYFEASRQKRVLFNCFATKQCFGRLSVTNTLALSGFHWLSLVLISRIQPFLGSQGPCSALIADATMTHFVPLCSRGGGLSRKKWVWICSVFLHVSDARWCGTHIFGILPVKGLAHPEFEVTTHTQH